MDGCARVCGHGGDITVLNPQTLVSNTSKSDRIHTHDNELNRKHYLQYEAGPLD